MARLRDVPHVLRTVGPIQFALRVWRQGSEDFLMTWASALAYAWLFAVFPFFVFLMTLVPYLPIKASQKKKRIVCARQFQNSIRDSSKDLIERRIRDFELDQKFSVTDRSIAHRKTGRPRLVIGFAAETEKVVEHARIKLARKACDWILANDVSPATGIMGGDSNTIHLVTANSVEHWPPQSKTEVASQLVSRIAAALGERP